MKRQRRWSAWAILKDAILKFGDDDGWAIASHIALTSLTSLFPFLIFATALAGSFGFQDLADRGAQAILNTWPQQVAEPLVREIENVIRQPRGGIATIGAVLALYFSSSGIEALRTALNRAYGERDERAWWILRLESIAYVLVGALAVLALAVLIILGPLLWDIVIWWLPELQVLQVLVTWLRYGVATAVMGLALLVIHKWLPVGRQRLARIAPGVVTTLVASLAFGFIFGAYLTAFARNYVSTYAGLATPMIALVFLYALSTIFVFGGELNAAVDRAMTRARNAAKEEAAAILAQAEAS